MEGLCERGRSPHVFPFQTIRGQPSAVSGPLTGPTRKGLTVPPMPEKPINGATFAPQLFPSVAPKVRAEQAQDRLGISHQRVVPL